MEPLPLNFNLVRKAQFMVIFIQLVSYVVFISSRRFDSMVLSIMDVIGKLLFQKLGYAYAGKI